MRTWTQTELSQKLCNLSLEIIASLVHGLSKVAVLGGLRMGSSLSAPFVVKVCAPILWSYGPYEHLERGAISVETGKLDVSNVGRISLMQVSLLLTNLR